MTNDRYGNQIQLPPLQEGIQRQGPAGRQACGVPGVQEDSDGAGAHLHSGERRGVCRGSLGGAARGAGAAKGAGDDGVRLRLLPNQGSGFRGAGGQTDKLPRVPAHCQGAAA